MIIALKTRILVIEIAICEARAGEGGGGVELGGFLRSM